MPPRRHPLVAFSLIAFLGILVLLWRDLLVLHALGPSRGDHLSSAGCKTAPAACCPKTEYHALDLDSIQTYPPLEDSEHFSPTARVLVLTPLMEASTYLDGYFKQLSKLVYPKELISLGFLVSTTTEDGQEDPTLQALHSHVSTFLAESSYRRITVIKQTSEAFGYSHDERHTYDVQISRRRVLARCRNALLSSALMDESWVLWLDADVVEYSPELLLDLMRMDKDVVVPNCLRKEPGWLVSKTVPYDRNNWLETTESMAHQRVLDEGEILFEGYEPEHPTYRQSMADLDRDVPRAVPLDGVGGTFTLVKAAVHRSGVNFPAEALHHALETEGLAKWAKQRGFSVFGAPHLVAQHA